MDRYALGRPPKKRLALRLLENWEYLAMLLPAFTVVLIFHYIPIYGVQMAFRETRFGTSFLSGNWIGFDNFTRFFRTNWFPIVMRNTIFISVVSHFLIWPIPIVLALMLHNCYSGLLRRFTQSVTYIPHLLSIVVVMGIVNLFCNGQTGMINLARGLLGMDAINFFGREDMVIPLYTISGLWQNAGFSAIVYLASLSSVDEEIVEAAVIDGASKFRRILHIDIPWILPTIVTMFILSMGNFLSVGLDKMLLLQTDLNIGASEVISTYVYKSGIQNAQFGYATAVGLFNSLINLCTLLLFNAIARKATDSSIL